MLFVSAAIGFVMVPFMAHHLGDKLFGIWTLVGTFSGTCALLDLGLSRAVGRFVAIHIGNNDFRNVNVYVNTALVIYCLMGVAVVLGAFGLTFFASTFGDTPEDASILAVLMLIVGTEFALSLPMRTMMGTITASLRYDVSTAIELVFKLVSTALIVGAILLGGQLVSIALIGLVLGVFRGIVWYIAARRVTPELRISPSLARRQAAQSLCSFSIFIFIAQVATILRFHVDSVVIGGFLGPQSITHYAVAATLTALFINATTSIMGVLSPVFAQQHGRDDIEAMRRTLFFGLRVGTSIAMFMAFGLLAWGRPFIELWMGQEYLDAYPCLAVITVGLVAALCQTSAIGVLYARSKPGYFALSNGIEGVGNAVCSIVLVQYWGILGVAIGTCIPMVIVKLTVQPWLVSRVLGISAVDYLLVIFRAAVFACIALVVPSILTCLLVEPNYLSLIVTGVLCAITYFAVVGVMNLTADERSRISSSIR
jgi:O-antigen/teichoic acid export membrane protein